MRFKEKMLKSVLAVIAILLLSAGIGGTVSAAARPGKTSFTRQTEAYAKKVVLKWRQAKRASGYEIYRSE